MLRKPLLASDLLISHWMKQVSWPSQGYYGRRPPESLGTGRYEDVDSHHCTLLFLSKIEWYLLPNFKGLYSVNQTVEIIENCSVKHYLMTVT